MPAPYYHLEHGGDNEMQVQPMVLFEESNGVGWMKLNNHRRLNALSFEMVDRISKQLEKWEENDQIALVCMYGEGEKGLCAGGDIRSLYHAKGSNLEETVLPFFVKEYSMDLAIHRYQKPILVYMDGLVMGGGVGLSIGCKYRIVTEKTKWAMPEMNIGFFPDVGASYFLNQMPGYIGRYLAVTAATIESGDILYTGAADLYMESVRWNDLERSIRALMWTEDSVELHLNNLLDHVANSDLPESTLAALQEKIDQHFAFDTIEKILNSLHAAAINGDEWASRTYALIREKSPTSVKVALQQLKKGEDNTIEDCFKMELALSMNFMKNHDFFEGVRSVLIEKDGKPKWNPATLEEVDDTNVEQFFDYPWAEGRNPLS